MGTEYWEERGIGQMVGKEEEDRRRDRREQKRRV